MIEVWKDIKGYKGLYQISNLGRVKSLPKKRKNKSGTYSLYKEKIIKGNNCKGNSGRSRIFLYINGKRKQIKIHHLVALHFIAGYEANKTVNHIDGNRLNNHMDNLEWITKEENLRHGWKNNLYKNAIKTQFKRKLK